MVNLFAHRGFWTSKDLQNSISSLNAAHDNKFYGIEFDLWFCEGILVVSHDQPRRAEDHPTFSEYLKYGNDFKYWIDCKNLDLANAARAFTKIKNNIKEAGIDMKNIYISPFITNYQISREIFDVARRIFGKKIKYAAVVEYKEEIKKLLEFIDEEKISYLSASHELINKKFIDKIPNVEFFAWTINDAARLEELRSLGVKNFITDKITPQIYEKRRITSRSQSKS